MTRGQPGPRAQVGGSGEAVHVTDLGDEYRGQRRSDAWHLLDRVIAAVRLEPLGDQPGEAGLMVVEDVDEFPNRAHPLGVGGPQRALSCANLIGRCDDSG